MDLLLKYLSTQWELFLIRHGIPLISSQCETTGHGLYLRDTASPCLPPGA